MAPITITAIVSLADAIRSGSGVHGDACPITLDLDGLDASTRAALADLLTTEGRLLRARSCAFATLPAATPEAVLVHVREAQAAEQVEQVERERREADARRHAAAALLHPETLAQGESLLGAVRIIDRFPSPEGYTEGHYSDYRAAYDAYPGIREARSVQYARIRADQDRRHQERAANEEARIRSEATAKQAAQERLRAWATAHGSERLRALIEEKFSWEGVAEDEFFAANTPSGFFEAADMPGDDWERKTRTKPSLEEIQALRSLRRDCEGSDGILSEPDLEFAVATFDEDEDGERPEAEKFSMLSVTVTAPNGKKREVFRRL